METSLKRYLCVAALIPSVALTSCSNMSDASITQVQGTGGGAVLGGAIGAGAGALIGGDSKGALWGAAIGGLIGAFVGHQYAQSIVKQKSEYASVEAYLNANIEQLSIRYKEVNDTNLALSKHLDELRAKKKAYSKEKCEKIQKASASKAELAQTDITVAKQALGSSSGTKRAELLKYISQLEEQRRLLIENTNALIAVSSSNRGSI